MENYRRVAVYAGNQWPMDDIDPQVFLDEALVQLYPDLRGARFDRRVDDASQTIFFEFAKRAGQKG